MKRDNSAVLIVVTTTVASIDDARDLADQMIAARLAACVQIDGPIESRYQWDGRQQCTPEHRLQAKSTLAAWPRLQQFIAQSHPYDEPEIIMQPAADASAGYRDWVLDQVSLDRIG